MKLSDTSIKRPIFTAMIMCAVVVFGAVMYRKLSVDLFPKVDFPIVTVTVIYPGADPETMESKVADPIEEAINTLSGIKALRSTNLESVSQIVVEFELDVPSEQAVQDIRDRVSGVLSQLPEGNETPVIFPYFYFHLSATRSNVTGIIPTGMGHLDLTKAGFTS